MTVNLDALSKTRKSLQAWPKNEADVLSRIGAPEIGLAAADEMARSSANSQQLISLSPRPEPSNK